MAEDSLAILPRSMGQQAQPGAKKKAAPVNFIPSQRGGLITSNPLEEECPYTFSDSPAYTRQKKAEEQAKRAAELEGKDETRGFLRSVEELARKQKWEDAYNMLEKRTAVPSGLFLVTRALLRWKASKFGSALQDAEEALKLYGSSAKAGPLAAAFASFARLCLGSEVRDKGSCSREMGRLIDAWEQAERSALQTHALGQGLFKPRQDLRLQECSIPVEGMEAEDGTYTASGLRIGYVLLKNQRDATAPLVLHFHGSGETAADYRLPALAEKYRDIPVHVLAVDYRGYGWSAGEPSLATFLKDAEPLAEKLPGIFVQHGLPWPYPGGLILSGRSLGTQVAIHLAVMFPTLFRALVLDSAMAASATGDRLGKAPERAAALQQWRKELEQASLEVLQPLDTELWTLGTLDKIRSFTGPLLLLHGLDDELVPYESSESLHAAAGSREKELVLVKDAGHNDIGRHDEYWTALRRFSLKVQLDSSLPSVGPALEHLCAVCAEKAVSKCGRCQKVWYCGRAHQAEHWKTHKATCAGGPPQPTTKVVPEAEASLSAVVCAGLRSQSDGPTLESLFACLSTAVAQELPYDAIHVSWHADSEDLANKVQAKLQELREKHPDTQLSSIQSLEPLSFFEHVEAAAGALAKAPGHAWVSFLDPTGILSPRHCTLLLPSLRRAAADSRVLAVRCRRCSRPSAGKALAPTAASEVDAALSDGSAQIVEAEDDVFVNLSVRAKTLQAFLQTTPAVALRSELCRYRFVHKMTNTFGKKVLEATVPNTEWMQFVQRTSAAPSLQAEAGDSDEFADDRRRGQELTSSSGQRFSSSTELDALPVRLRDADSAAEMISELRRSIERRLILKAGESIDGKDMRELSMDLTTSALEAAALDQVIGIQGWAKRTAAELSEAAARKFEVKISEP